MSTSGPDRLDVLADPVRRALLERLAQRPVGIEELCQDLPLSPPAAAQHLAALAGAGLVLDRQDTTRRIYQVDLAGVGALRAYFDRLWNQALAAVKQEAEAGQATDVPDGTAAPP